jgi:hypothetical protein
MSDVRVLQTKKYLKKKTIYYVSYMSLIILTEMSVYKSFEVKLIVHITFSLCDWLCCLLMNAE